MAATVLAACSAKDPSPVPRSGGAPTSAAVASADESAAATMGAAAPPASGSASINQVVADVAAGGMVTIPEGTFRMGGTGLEDSPMHAVVIARFELDRTEVTMDAYRVCVDAGSCEPPKGDNPFCNAKLENRGKHPVNCVDYRNADAYCAFVKKRLPSEREWEYAARGGPEQRTFSWGEELPDTKRACYMHQGGSCEVGSYAPGAFGLYDMSGNVWEWTSSWFANYPDEPAVGLFKVYRGGSWSRRFPKWLHNELRNRYRTDEQSASLGVRCARSVKPVVCPDGAEAQGEGCAPKGSLGKTTALPRASANAAGGAPCPSGKTPASTVPKLSTSGEPDGQTAPPKIDPRTETPLRVRSSEFDADCGHYPGYPVSFTWRGGTFQAREPLVSSSGCKKRDIGVGWTSTCCPQ